MLAQWGAACRVPPCALNAESLGKMCYYNECVPDDSDGVPPSVAGPA
jgi:hypothetical protein